MNVKRSLRLPLLLIVALLSLLTSTAWATEYSSIDFVSTITESSISFSDFSNAGSKYTTSIQGAFTASDGNGYSGWSKTDAMYQDNNHKNILQLKGNSGILTSPTITSSNGVTVTVTYGSTTDFILTVGNEKVTGSKTSAANGTEGTVSLTTTSNSCTFKIEAGSKYLRVSKIEITPTAGSAATVATPTFNVGTGTYNNIQNVEISCTTDGASIYYTTDDTDPTASSTAYTGAIKVNKTTTIKAIAINGEDQSSVAEATYTMECATPEISPASYTGDKSQTVTISCATTDAVIY